MHLYIAARPIREPLHELPAFQPTHKTAVVMRPPTESSETKTRKKTEQSRDTRDFLNPDPLLLTVTGTNFSLAPERS